MKKLSDEQVRMFDRMRARRGRIMKRLDAKAPDNSGPGLKTHYGHATHSSPDSGLSTSSGMSCLEAMIYLALICVPFLMVFLGLILKI